MSRMLKPKNVERQKETKEGRVRDNAFILIKRPKRKAALENLHSGKGVADQSGGRRAAERSTRRIHDLKNSSSRVYTQRAKVVKKKKKDDREYKILQTLSATERKGKRRHEKRSGKRKKVFYSYSEKGGK